MNKEKALSLAAASCSKKEHCSKEVREKLQRWEIEEEAIGRIMTFLCQHKFIDDTRYARIYAEAAADVKIVFCIKRDFMTFQATV